MNNQTIFYFNCTNVQDSLDSETHSIQYISKKNFNKFAAFHDYTIVGKTLLKKADNENSRNLVIGDVSYDVTTQISSSKCIGYIPVGNNSFIELYKSNVLVIVCIVIAIICIACAVFFVFFNHKNTNTDSALNYDSGQHEIVTEETTTEAETVQEMPAVIMPGYTELEIEAGATTIDDSIRLFNPEANDGWYDMKFTILIDVDHDGNYKQLYESGLVSPGKEISSVTLSEPLTAGEYDGQILIQPYLQSDTSVGLNNGLVNITVYVN